MSKRKHENNQEKWLLVEWNNGKLEVVNAQEVIKPVEEMKKGNTVQFKRPAGQETGKILALGQNRQVLEIQKHIPKKQEDEPNINDKLFQDPENEEPAEYQSSASSWEPSDESSESEEEENPPKKVKMELNRIAQYSNGKNKRKVLVPSHRANAVIPKCMLEKNKKTPILPNGTFVGGPSEKENHFPKGSRTVKKSTQSRTNYNVSPKTKPDDYVFKKPAPVQKKSNCVNLSSKNNKCSSEKPRLVIVDYNKILALKNNFKQLLRAVKIMKQEQKGQNNANICNNVKNENNNNNTTLEDNTRKMIIKEHNNKSVNENINSEVFRVGNENGSININQTKKIEVSENNNTKVNNHKTTLDSIEEKDEDEKSEGDEFNSSDDNVLISNKYKSIHDQQSEMDVSGEDSVNTPAKEIKEEGEWIPIGSGKTLIHKDKFKRVKWTSYTIATRTLLLAAFPRRVLATHSLTGKRSPAFQNKPAKMCLDPKIVTDIIIEVSDRFQIKESYIRGIITTKCADECKMFRFRQEKKKRKSAPAMLENDENVPPPVGSNVTL